MLLLFYEFFLFIYYTLELRIKPLASSMIGKCLTPEVSLQPCSALSLSPLSFSPGCPVYSCILLIAHLHNVGSFCIGKWISLLCLRSAGELNTTTSFYDGNYHPSSPCKSLLNQGQSQEKGSSMLDLSLHKSTRRPCVLWQPSDP